MRALIVRHEAPTPPGLLGRWLDEHGAESREHRIDLEDDEVDPTGYDLIASLGSEFPAYDDSRPFVQREVRLMNRALEADVPVLGLCFGGQLLARVLGGEVFRNEESEIGWLRVHSNDTELVPEGPWFQWHFDSFTAPPGATVIAETDRSLQAFVAGRSLGVQFHPEVTPEIMDEWVRVYRHELDDEGVDPDALLEETRRLAEDNRRRARQLLETFLDRVAGSSSRSGRTDGPAT